jgi:cytochrome c-type biogenesis protein CcmH/NrfG
MAQSLTADAPSPGAVVGKLRWLHLGVGLVLVALVATGYWIKLRPAAEIAGQEALMKAGLDALYTKNDGAAAARLFRKVLELNPSHYGATLQLAKALDAAGRPQEARPYWEKMKSLAEEARDDETLVTVQKRLARRELPSEEATQEALMNAGLDALYKRNDPVAAAAEFRKVLDRNPTHYGATFQLARALDRAGKPAEARPLWEKVAGMAGTYKDQKTLALARERLARKP